MNRPEIVHIAPNNDAWRVYRAGYESELSFEDIGDALDAASSLVSDGASMRIVIHERASAEDADAGSFGVSAAA